MTEMIVELSDRISEEDLWKFGRIKTSLPIINACVVEVAEEDLSELCLAAGSECVSPSVLVTIPQGALGKGF